VRQEKHVFRSKNVIKIRKSTINKQDLPLDNPGTQALCPRIQHKEEPGVSAIKHLDSFFKEMNLNFSFDTMKHGDMRPDHLGTFSNWLCSKVGSESTAITYVSVAKCEILKKFPELESGMNNSAMRNINRNIKNQFNTNKSQPKSNKNIAHNDEEVDNNDEGILPTTVRKVKSKSMTVAHLYYLCKTLFESNDSISIANRCLIALDWTAIGKR
jgi:hypothetical protein